MPLPNSLLTTLTPLTIPSPAVSPHPAFTAPPPAAAGPPNGCVLTTMPHETQAQPYWCWAAVAACISAYFGTPRWQCEIANDVLNRRDCCGSAAAGACNKPKRPEIVLSAINHFRPNVITSSLPYADIALEIGSYHYPIACCIRWRGSGMGHLVVIYGYHPQVVNGIAVAWLEVMDPWPGVQSRSLSYRDFVNNYRGKGQWTLTYKTV